MARAKKKDVEVELRTLPQDLGAEAGVIGSIMLDGPVLDRVIGVVSADDFVDPAHAKLYRGLIALREANRPIDVMLLIEQLKVAGDFEAVGGAGYVAKISNAVPNAAHAVYYAEVVHKKATARRVIRICTNILTDAYDGADADDLVAALQSEALRLGMEARQDGIVSMRSAADAVVTALENPEALSRINRAMFGLPVIDRMVGPIMPGEMCVIAARPSLGKTSFAQQICRHSAERNRPALLISLEMDSRELAARELSRRTGIDSRIIRAGEITADGRCRLRNAQEDIDYPLFIWSPSFPTTAQIRSTLSKAVAEHGIRLVALDYASLIAPDREEKKLPRHEFVGGVCRHLKSMAKLLDVPMLVLQQLNRDAQDVEPTMKNIRESGMIEQDADMIMFLHTARNAETKEVMPDRRSLIVAKHRNGSVGLLTLGWNAVATTFTDPEEREPVHDRNNYEPTASQREF